jgi:hypothetical protein
MSRKSKIDPALKVQLVEQYLRDEIGVREAGRLAGLSGNGTDSFRKWVVIYQNDGTGECQFPSVVPSIRLPWYG